MASIPVRVRDCACPDTPHADEGDLVYLAPTLPMSGGILAEQQMFDAKGDGPMLTRLWLETFVRHGAVEWNLLDEAGDPVPFDVDVILADWSLARLVANQASELYADAVMAPFLTKPGARSPTGPTGPTTSRRQRRTR